jgi:hypothetical protein
MKKISYNEQLEQGSEGNPNGWMPENNSFFNDIPEPYSQYYPPGVVIDKDKYQIDQSATHQRDGHEFDEFRKFKRKKRLKRLKRLQRLNEMRENPTIQPSPFYQSLYGYTGFEGAMTSPLEYYSGSILEEPGAITNNEYNNSYQGGSFSGASDRGVRLQIRAMMLKDRICT